VTRKKAIFSSAVPHCNRTRLELQDCLLFQAFKCSLAPRLSLLFKCWEGEGGGGGGGGSGTSTPPFPHLKGKATLERDLTDSK